MLKLCTKATQLVGNSVVAESEQLFHKLGCWSKPEWTRPEVEAVIKLALDIKQQVLRLSPLNCNNWELSAAISAPTDVYRQLQVERVP